MNSPPLHDTLIQAEQLHADGCLEQAAHLYRCILVANPELSRTAYNLGIILLELQDYPNAEAAFEHCLRIEPQLLEARLNHSFALQEQGKIAEALTHYHTIIRTTADCIEARFNLACLQLLQGNLPEGLKGYELRFATNDPVTARHDAVPLWDGIIRHDMRLLVHAEQGYGDILQMLRYLPQLTGHGITVLLEVPRTLYALCCRVEGIQCIERGATVPDVDCRLPIMSLPHRLGTDLATIPAPEAYISADPALIRKWRGRLPDTSFLRVGICWAGRFDLPVNRKRSCPPELLRPLLGLQHVSFISLQVSPPDGFQLQHPELLDLSHELTDFSQTAALIANLDLVISIDTAVAHLAAALGTPTWLMLSKVSDWRWLLDKDDSPWYPSMRLFRQPEVGNWPAVISDVTQKLAQTVNPRIWSYCDGADFDSSQTATHQTPLSDRTRWPELGIIETEHPKDADWLLFPYYLEHITEYQTIAGMWDFLSRLPGFTSAEDRHILFSDHDSEARYHSSAAWFRASVSSLRHDPHAEIIPYRIRVAEEYIHFDPSRIRYHACFTGFIGLLRERSPMINGLISEPRLVHHLDLATSFHLHQSPELRQERYRTYLENSAASLCVLCPRGEGSSSQRFYETLALGRIAVIQSPTMLPFEDRIDYSRFVISIPLGQTGQTGAIIYHWLATLSDDELIQRCREARSAWERHLSPDVMAAGIIRLLCRRKLRRTPEPPDGAHHPGNADWQQEANHAAMLFLEGNLPEAHQRMTTALGINPRSAALHVTMSGIELELGKPESAELHLRDAILYDHRCYDAYLLLGRLLADTGRKEEAIGRCYQASLIRPDEPAPYQLALTLLQQQGRPEEADYCRERLTALAAAQGEVS